MHIVNSREEFETIIQEPGIHVFLFTTKWCGDCMFIKPFMPSVVEKFSTLHFCEVDRDVCLDLAVELEIMGIPSFVAYKDGKEISRFVSSLRKTREEIEAYLTKTISEGA